MQNFEKRKKWSRDMVKRYLSTKFDINMLDGFWENEFYGRTTDDRRRTTDGRSTDDGRPRDNSSSAVAQSRAKNSQ